ncbi:phosphoenolpyruvate--protein phosphotransferase [Kamptonema cortianum]|uniref:Phosphoenolpyruvate-protein phosphotransferase n=1 Tax=Geitlerinema calcuttense NRMC-F 0142 TaxID=2922238 RepID=A0ABT7M1G9_9CYAN|nr:MULTISPECIES: phosphoenolpyruvate--protein phosphotransferase [Cyanophyceae]MDK3157495.1 phosphoenolpyruvate--protein phosphotransferase [Kamptonema cortianum]MDL5052609.1 phosphoenolpyruvate--protein phosphotransferase [Oscillatoria laete-virens NRMC-F 0139]MDL5056911.1 phosphoenolpyruvate--protein phosphotransferase [Geitlerinema calcuttense NRMC-F 0142]
MSDEQNSSAQEQRFQGIGVSPGIAHGRTIVIGRYTQRVRRKVITPEEIDGEVAKLEQALLKTREEITAIQKQIASSIGEKDASIFDAHLLVVEDSSLIMQAVKEMQSSLLCIEFCYSRVARRYIKSLQQIDDDYLRERVADIEDVTRRVLRNLMGLEHRTLNDLPEPRIIVAYDLSPSDTATLDRGNVKGFATDIGSRTSHTAIMARSLNIPAVVGLHDISEIIENDQYILIDGYKGVLVINPTEKTLWEYGQIESQKQTIEDKLDEVRFVEPVTTDGRRIHLAGNIELPEDVAHVVENGAEGIGLYRTEFFFINRDTLPSEDEQYEAYAQVARTIKPHSVIVRTLDIGGDKFLSHLQIPQEMNPFLGWRAIRFCLARQDVFKTQLRAILRASAEGNVKIMYPMISGVKEVLDANALLEQCKNELRAEGKAFDEHISTGAMIEVPSAALTADRIAEEVDFLSIGTNDLIQYSIAVDRVNERIAYLYEPTHPAILQLIKLTAEAAHRKGIWCGICGEMGGEITLTPLLIGLGIDEISTGSIQVPFIKQAIRLFSHQEAQQLAQEVMQMHYPQEILDHCKAFAQRHYPQLLE